MSSPIHQSSLPSRAKDFVVSIVLLRRYPPPRQGVGSARFAVGKVIGIIGRIVFSIFLLGTVIFAALDARTLLLSFLTGYIVIALTLATEVLSSMLMYLGHRAAARAADA